MTTVLILDNFNYLNIDWNSFSTVVQKLTGATNPEVGGLLAYMFCSAAKVARCCCVYNPGQKAKDGRVYN